MPEGVVQLLEVVQVGVQARQSRPRVQGVMLGEVALEQLEQAAPVAEAGEVVGDRLAVAALGQLTQPAHRDDQAGAGHEQRRDREPDRDPAGRVQAGEGEDRQRRQGPERREQETGRLLRLARVAPAAWQPDGDRDQQHRHRPRDLVDGAAHARCSDGGAEQVEGVPRHVERHARGEQHPRRAAPTREHRARAGDQEQQQQVADGIREVDGHLQGPPAGEPHDVVKGERGADRRGAEPRHGTVEPARPVEPPCLPAHHQHDPPVCEWEEAEVEGVCHRGHGWGSPIK